MGASSRVVAVEDTIPVAGSSPSRCSALYPSMATIAPADAPRTMITPAVPPPTTREPLPQVTSERMRRNSFR